MPGGSIESVTTFSYLKYKIKFYQISSSIIGDLYFHRSTNVVGLAAKVSRIHEELVEFHNNLPPELRLEKLCPTPDTPVTPETRPFILQALALQVAYDNVQILLHRPLLSQDLQDFKDNKASEFSDDQLNLEAGAGRMLHIRKTFTRSFFRAETIAGSLQYDHQTWEDTNSVSAQLE